MTTNGVLHRSRIAKSHFVKILASVPVSFSLMTDTQHRPAQYFFALAHEVRNPLCNINLACDMLKFANLDEEQRTCLDIIMRGSTRINDLINILLKSEEVEEIKYEHYSLQQLLEDVIVITRDRILLKQVEVSRAYATTERGVLMDIDKMKIAITNIVINAIDAMTFGKGQLKLTTKLIDETISMEIQDNGVGISKENMERMFEPYFTNKPGGMGLGLSATLEILKANQARVSVQSEEGVGTCFILSFDR
jgi:signal transduction histidine kinase